MATRQYIGARYVTKIYENSQDASSAEWEANVTYEPLTMVTYQNSSYLSKKEVPGNIGNPAANPAYWVVTGAYNGQIAHLQNQIDIINNIIGDISDLDTNVTSNIVSALNSILNNNRRYILISDSYGNQPTPNESWQSKVVNAMQLTLNDNVFVIWSGGAHFMLNTDGTSDGNTFKDILEAEENNITNPNTITDIVVVGGYNDCFITTLAQLNNGIAAFINYAKSTYPNAKIHIGMGGTGRSAQFQTAQYAILKCYQNCVDYKNCVYMSEIEYALTGTLSLQSDGVHPTAYGSNNLGRNVINHLMGESVIYDNQMGNLAGSWAQIASIPSGVFDTVPNMLQRVSGQFIELGPENYIFHTTDAINADGYDKEVASFNTFALYGRDSKYDAFGIGTLTVGSTGKVLPCPVRIKNGKLYISPLDWNGTAFQSIPAGYCYIFFKIMANRLFNG